MYLAKWTTRLMEALRRLSQMEPSAQLLHLLALSWMSWLSLATLHSKILILLLERQLAATLTVQLEFSMLLQINF